MLSREKLADIVRDEVENLIRKGKIPVGFYYILFDGRIYLRYKYEEEVANGIRSANDIYAYVGMWTISDFDTFLFLVNYLDIRSVSDIVDAYLRKSGFTIANGHDELPAPNLKYFIDALVKFTPDYLVVNVYDIDALATTFHIPQIVEQRLGNKPRKITEDEFSDINSIVADEQPLLAGYTYEDAYDILDDYYVNHIKKYKNKAYKISLAYSQLFPTPYQVCYERKTGIFDETDCLKLLLGRFSS